MGRISLILVVLAALIALASASSAPTFCKCTCFTNSTIIKMGPPSGGGGSSEGNSGSSGHAKSSALARHLYSAQSSSPNRRRHDLSSSSSSGLIAARANSPSCFQCNRAFCLEYNLPICKGAEEKDVMTMCFQRDSRKDQIIVWGFILGTGGLLGWAAAKRAIEAREARANEQQRSRDPLLPGGGAGSGDGATGPMGFVNGLLARIGITGRDASAGAGVGSGTQYAPLGRT